MTPGHVEILRVLNEAGYFPLKSELRFINTLSGTIHFSEGGGRGPFTSEYMDQLYVGAAELYFKAKAANSGKRPDLDALHNEIRDKARGFVFGFRSK